MVALWGKVGYFGMMLILQFNGTTDYVESYDLILIFRYLMEKDFLLR